MDTTKLVAAQKNLDAFIEANAGFVFAYDSFKRFVEEAENELKEACRANKENADVPELGVKYSFIPAYRKSVDVDLAYKLCQNDPVALHTLESMTKATIDPKDFMEAVKTERLPNDVRIALTETEMSPRIIKSEIDPQ